MSLRRRMYLMGLVGLAPLLAAGIWNEWSNRTLRATELRKNLAEEAVHISNEFQRQLEGVESLLQTLSVLPVLQGRAPITCDELFDRVRPQNPVIAALGATDIQGNVTCASDRTEGETLPSIADRPHFRRALETLRPALGGYVLGRRTARRVIHMSVPYRNEAGALAGVVFAAISLDVIAQRYESSQWTASRVVTVIDAEGTIIMRQPDYAKFVGQEIASDRWAWLQSMRNPGYYEANSSVDGVSRIIGFSPLSADPKGLFIGVGVDRDEAFAPLNAATGRSLLASLIALLLALGSAWFVARNLIGKPWRRILRAASKLQEGDLTARAHVRGKGEFADLASAFNSVADQLVAALSRKDMLLRELSHRVMNSLQVINSVLRMQERSATTDEAQKQLREAASRVQALAMTYRRLHELNGAEAVDIGDLVVALSKEIARSLLRSENQINIDVAPYLIATQRAMSFALVANELLTNAAKYGGETARIDVSLHVTDEKVTFKVTNCRSVDENLSARPGGFGTKMMTAMIRDLNGSINNTQTDLQFEALVTFPA